MTKNAFIFSWDQEGIEAIVPITEYEHHDKQNLMRILSEKPTVRNPLNGIIQHLLLRARFNPRLSDLVAMVGSEKLLLHKF